MSDLNKKFINITLTTTIKVYSENADAAKAIALENLKSMSKEEIEDNFTVSSTDVRTESNEPKEFKLINEEYDVWGYPLDDRTFIMTYGLSDKDITGELDFDETTIDLDDDKYEYATVCQSDMIYFAGQHPKCIEYNADTTSDIELAALLYIEEEGL